MTEAKAGKRQLGQKSGLLPFDGNISSRSKRCCQAESDLPACRAAAVAEAKAGQRQLGKKAGLLSFEEDNSEGEGEGHADNAAPPAKRSRILSAHDAGQDPRCCLSPFERMACSRLRYKAAADASHARRSCMLSVHDAGAGLHVLVSAILLHTSRWSLVTFL